MVEIVDKQNAYASRMRRVLYATLKDELTEDRLMKALWMWQGMSASNPGVSIKDFVAYLAERIELRKDPEEIVRHVFKMRFLPDKQLEEDPWTRMQDYDHYRVEATAMPGAVQSGSNKMPASNVGSKAADGDNKAQRRVVAPSQAWLVVGNFFLETLHNRLELTNPGSTMSFKKHIRDQLEASGLSVRAVHHLSRACQQPGPIQFDHAMNVDEVSSVIHKIYVWCCELLGPVMTDKLYEQVMRAAEGIPEAIAFSPRKFL